MFYFRNTIFLLFGLCANCITKSPCVDSHNFYCVHYIKNYDGDTITVDIKGVHPLIGKSIKIRVNHIDTPEIKGSAPCEKQKAQEAQQVTAHLLTHAKKIILKNIKRGKYFRIAADVWADDISIGDYLIKKGLAYRYAGHKKPKVNWCHDPALPETPSNAK